MNDTLWVQWGLQYTVITFQQPGLPRPGCGATVTRISTRLRYNPGVRATSDVRQHASPLIWNDLSSTRQYLMGSCLLLILQHLRWPSRKDGESDGRTGHYRRLINLIFACLVPEILEPRMTFIRRELPLSTIACSGLSPNA